MSIEEQKQRAQQLRKEAREKPVDIADVLGEALLFVSRHSEPWYYSGQELCGQIEGAIEQYGGKGGLYTHMLECAKAAGFASITEAIAAAKVARNPWTPVSKHLPVEPGWYLVMLAPDNDWGLMSDTALQVEFGAYTATPQAFTYSDGWHDGPQDITEAVLDWMPMPRPPVRPETHAGLVLPPAGDTSNATMANPPAPPSLALRGLYKRGDE